MHRHLLWLLAGALICGLLAAPGALAAFTPVTVRVEGPSRTVLPETSVTTLSDDTLIDKDNNPAHAAGCPGSSAAGALEMATRSSWTASFSDGLGYFVTGIRGQRPTGNGFWSLWVNNRQTTTGICTTSPPRGAEILLFISSCNLNPSTQRCTGAPTPLGLRVPRSARLGQDFTVTVVSYAESGRATPVAGATVRGAGDVVRTNSRGQATIESARPGRNSFQATRNGNVRSAVEYVQIR